MFHSIRWRIAFSYIFLTLAAMLVLGVYLSSFIRQTYLDDLESHLAAEARTVGEIIRPNFKAGAAQFSALVDSNPLDEAARKWAKTLGARLTIIAPDGVVLGESDEDWRTMNNHLDRPEVAAAIARGQGSSIRYSQTVGYNMLYTAIRLDGPSSALAIVRLSVPLDQVQTHTAQLQRILLTVTLLVAGLAVLLATWIASRTTRPLRELTEAARQVARGKLSTQIITSTRDEVGQLTQAFNTMAQQLDSHIHELETEHGKLEAVLQKMSDGVLIVDSEGYVQLLNPATQAMFEITAVETFSPSSAKRWSLSSLIRRHQVFELWQKCRNTGEIQQTFFDINKRLSLQAVATPLGQALPGSTLLLFQDITRQRQIEVMRRDFISNVSHELRTPLAALKALTETLQAVFSTEDGVVEDPPTARRFLERMQTEVDALSLMVTELVELSRIESGRVPLELKHAQPLEILSLAYERLGLQAESADLSVSIECPEDLPAVLADANRLQQVVINLLHNAIKFTPAGGKIVIGATLQSNEVVFFVRDTGIGISSEDLLRIFERFYKVDRARSSSGTGLGLAIAKHLVEAHKGKIWAESQVSQGSVFYFTIPTAG
jgi:two-component system phosphate regulon sensor histidine kinase PhoR